MADPSIEEQIAHADIILAGTVSTAREAEKQLGAEGVAGIWKNAEIERAIAATLRAHAALEAKVKELEASYTRLSQEYANQQDRTHAAEVEKNALNERYRVLLNEVARKNA